MKFDPYGKSLDGYAVPPELQAYLEQLYTEAWRAYEQAGCPFGPTDEAMLIWFEFDRQTRAN